MFWEDIVYSIYVYHIQNKLRKYLVTRLSWQLGKGLEEELSSRGLAAWHWQTRDLQTKMTHCVSLTTHKIYGSRFMNHLMKLTSKAPLTNLLINHLSSLSLTLLVLQEVGSIIGKKGDNIKKIRIEVRVFDSAL